MKLNLVDLQELEAAAAVPGDRLGELTAPLGRPSWELNLVLVTDAAMADLNARHYGGEGVTDVLSFSYLEEEGPGEPHLAAGEGAAARDLWLPPLPGDEAPLAGEIVLAPAFVAGRCRREGWDLAAEVALLTVHGALHVLGWRHDDEASTQAMRRREATELARLQLEHPLLAEESGA